MEFYAAQAGPAAQWKALQERLEEWRTINGLNSVDAQSWQITCRRAHTFVQLVVRQELPWHRQKMKEENDRNKTMHAELVKAHEGYQELDQRTMMAMLAVELPKVMQSRKRTE